MRGNGTRSFKPLRSAGSASKSSRSRRSSRRRSFDLLCHLAFNAPLRTRRERAQRLKQERKDFFENYGPEARQILDELLEKYAQHGDAQFVLPDVLRVPPISDHGRPGEFIKLFGGPEQLRQAVNDLQVILYGS